MTKDLKKLRTLSRESSVKAVVTATKSQLMEIGCYRDLMELEVDVIDIDRWSGYYAPCSTVIIETEFDKIFTMDEEYIIPTRWLNFSQK